MTTHKVKSWVPFFQAFKRGEKKHDMRDMIDRDYKVGDEIILEEYDPFKGEYTGDTLRAALAKRGGKIVWGEG